LNSASNSEIAIDWTPKRAVYTRTQDAGPAALEQSWAYGDALADVSANDIWRGIIEIDGAPVATVQTVEKRLPGGLILVRLTRGPVLAQPGLLSDIVYAIRADYPRFSRNLLFWMPDTADPAPVMRRIGKRPMTTGYTTAWLDLRPEPEILRANLRGKWRNALAQAETTPPKVHLDQRGRETEDFIAEYLRDRRSRKYSGPSAALVRAIAGAFARDVFLLQATDHGDVIASSLFLRHGRSATYFLSWTTDHGRERNAAHYLMWDGIERLRKAGVHWLDLGGMDARAPGVARFKMGVGANPVTASGTWF
tara:strand:- start:13967 stop:14890 length:924 start_codon:yes stop_codon:yes gene_type:complete